MKKFSACLLLVVVAVLLTGCQAFDNQTERRYPMPNPDETTVYVQFNTGYLVDAGVLQTLLANLNHPANQTTDDKPYVVSASFAEGYEIAGTKQFIYPLHLTIANVPDQVLTLTTKPFTITKTQTVFNPISLLPTHPALSYFVMYSAERRHSAVTTPNVTHEDNEYHYIWTDGRDIVFTDYYPNRPLYYFIVLGATLLVGVIIYVVTKISIVKRR